MTLSDDKLAEFRDQIDAIDDELFALIKKRSGIVQKVGKLKTQKQANRCFIRPGREAIMSRNLLKVDVGHFPKPYLIAMWRMLIAGSTNIEQPITACVSTEPHGRDFLWMVREYFGPSTRLSTEGSPERVIRHVADRQSMVGLVPHPRDLETPWWLQLINSRLEWPKVFAVIPFLGDSISPDALAIGEVKPEETGKDISLLVMHGREPLSVTLMNSAFKKAKIKPLWRTECESPNDPQQRYYLHEVEGFLDEGSPELKIISDALGDKLLGLHSIGAYAAPINEYKD